VAAPLFRGCAVEIEDTGSGHDVVAGNIDPFLTMIFELAGGFGSQMMRGMLAHISEVCDAEGQTINAEGREFIEVVIETL
jgi:hypothetical protein